MDIKIKEIKDAVSTVYGLDIKSKRKTKDYVLARQTYYKIACDVVGYTYEKAGKEVNRNHSTVLFNLRNFERDLDHMNNKSGYINTLNYLNITDPFYYFIKKDTINKNKATSELLSSILIELNELSYSELSKFNETRLKPFKLMLNNKKRTNTDE